MTLLPAVPPINNIENSKLFAAPKLIVKARYCVDIYKVNYLNHRKIIRFFEREKKRVKWFEFRCRFNIVCVFLENNYAEHNKQFIVDNECGWNE